MNLPSINSWFLRPDRSCDRSSPAGGWKKSAALALLLLGSLPMALAQNSLVGWWQLDDGIGNPAAQTAVDASGNGNDGSLQGFPTNGSEWVTGRIGGALYFANADGLGDNVVSIPDAPSLDFGSSPAFTLCAWVTTSVTNQLNGAAIIAKGYGDGGEQYVLDVSNNIYQFYVRDGSDVLYVLSSTNSPYSGNLWQQVVATCDCNAGVMDIYINGQLVATRTSPASLLDTGFNLSIGNRTSLAASGYDLGFIGIIDDVRIYNYALSSSAVLALYQTPPAIPPAIYVQPQVPNIYAGGNPMLSALADGITPLTYQWQLGGNAITHATNQNLTIANLTASNSGNYDLVVKDTDGSVTSTVVNVSAIVPNWAYASNFMALGPLYFWQLNESNGTVAYDYASGFNGTYGATMNLGQSGVADPFLGFPTNYLAAGMDPTTSNPGSGYVTVPPLGLSSSNVTFTAWIYPNTSLANGTGFIFTRTSTDIAYSSAGMDYYNGIGYTWNEGSPQTYDWASGLVPANNSWSFVAVVLNGTKAIAYLGGTNGILYSATNLIPNDAETWNGVAAIGADPAYIPGRVFNGQMNDVGVFNKALTPTQIQSLYNLTGIAPSIVSLPTTIDISVGQSTNIAASFSGSTPLSYTWYYVVNGTSNYVASGTSSTYSANSTISLTNVPGAQNGALYYLSVSNAYGTAVSNAALNVSTSPGNLTGPLPAATQILAGQTATFTISADGQQPLYYQWAVNGTAVPGATSATFTDVNVPAGTWAVTCTITNTAGSITSSAATLTALAQTAFESQLLALAPIDYWPLNDTNGTVAYDYGRGLDGTYGSAVTLGQPGVTDPPFLAFPTNYVGAEINNTTSTTGAGYVTVPPLGFSSSNVTFTAWIYPNTTVPNGTGLIYTRASTYTAGMQYYNGIGYTWNHASAPTYNWASGLVPTNNAWSFVAVVLNGTKAIAYLGGTNGILYSATNSITNDVETWNGVAAIGADPAVLPGRIFNGTMNDAAVFNYALTPTQIQSLYNLSGIAPSIVSLPATLSINADQNSTLTASFSGSTPLNYIWYYVINGASNYVASGTSTNYSTTSSLSLNVPGSQNGALYYLSVSNAYGTVVSNTVLNVFTSPSIVSGPSPADMQILAGQTAIFTISADGQQPIYYQWAVNGTAVPGATSATFTDDNVPAGTWAVTCTVTNAVSSITSSAATLTALAPTAFESQLLALAPVDYWPLNETNGTVAYDYGRGLDGTYGSAVILGQPGVADPPFMAFPTNYVGVEINNTTSTTGAGYVTVPPLGLSSSNVSFTAWIYPYTNLVNGTGLIYTRASTYTAGMQYYNGIGYTWNHASSPTYNWASGLVPTTNAWSFVAVVLNGTKAIAYLGAQNGILYSATNSITNDVETWNGSAAIGADPANVPGRVFSGTMNDAAVFNYALSPGQISQLFAYANNDLTLTIQASGQNIILTWTGTLVQSTTLEGPWTPVPDAVSPYTVAPTGNQMFYRAMTQNP